MDSIPTVEQIQDRYGAQNYICSYGNLILIKNVPMEKPYIFDEYVIRMFGVGGRILYTGNDFEKTLDFFKFFCSIYEHLDMFHLNRLQIRLERAKKGTFQRSTKDIYK